MQKNGAFCRVKHKEMSSFVFNNGFRLPENKHDCQSLKRTSNETPLQFSSYGTVARDKIPQGSLRPRPAILKAEKALETKSPSKRTFFSTDQTAWFTRVSYRACLGNCCIFSASFRFGSLLSILQLEYKVQRNAIIKAMMKSNRLIVHRLYLLLK